MYMQHIRYPGSGYLVFKPEVPLKLADVAGFQVAVVQRLTTDRNLMAIRMLKQQRGMKVVYDLDDNIWMLPKYNPAYHVFRNPRMLKGAELCVRECNKVTVSTEWLATIVRRKLGNDVPVEVVENAIDLDLFYQARKPVERPYVTIGWAGTPTHHIDLAYAMNALVQVMQSREDVRCEFMGGAGPPDTIKEMLAKKKLDPVRVVWHPWISPREYPAWMSCVRWDIALAPLSVENEFNKSKSNIKMLEASAMGIPCLASPTLEYARFCEGNPVLENLLCNRQSEWVEKMNAFVTSRELRIWAAEQMRIRTLARYNMATRLEQWNKVYENI